MYSVKSLKEESEISFIYCIYLRLLQFFVTYQSTNRTLKRFCLKYSTEIICFKSKLTHLHNISEIQVVISDYIKQKKAALKFAALTTNQYQMMRYHSKCFYFFLGSEVAVPLAVEEKNTMYCFLERNTAF